ncbi:hypothetical protein LX36DRAFT_666378 [Colletotrichum falcatum]|nr:hypothetical protein LX36DRAFT_666378 [Colletotrichum falcatum]
MNKTQLEKGPEKEEKDGEREKPEATGRRQRLGLSRLAQPEPALLSPKIHSPAQRRLKGLDAVCTFGVYLYIPHLGSAPPVWSFNNSLLLASGCLTADASQRVQGSRFPYQTLAFSPKIQQVLPVALALALSLSLRYRSPSCLLLEDWVQIVGVQQADGTAAEWRRDGGGGNIQQDEFSADE